MLHQTSPASKWFSVGCDKGAWQILGLHLMGCWFKGWLCFAFLPAPLHTHAPFTLTFSSEGIVHVSCHCQWLLCGWYWSWCCSRDAAAQVVAAQWVLIQSLHASNQITLCSLNRGWLELAENWKAAFCVRAFSLPAIATAKAGGADAVLVARDMLGSGGCKVFSKHQKSGLQSLLFCSLSGALLHWTSAPGTDWYYWIIFCSPDCPAKCVMACYLLPRSI